MTVRDDDRGLVEGLRRREASAVEALVDRYAGWIYRVAARVLGDRRDAEEVAQDVLAVDCLGGLPGVSYRPWCEVSGAS
ncbi:MAG: hypothetical protein HY217_01185 [Candidatus Rokubacteria bacterium]|nr:hypothetical protein [Candidatus Rokubacteria bacterium]